MNVADGEEFVIYTYFSSLPGPISASYVLSGNPTTGLIIVPENIAYHIPCLIYTATANRTG